MQGEVWITTDGRAYFVQLNEDDIMDYEPDVGPQEPELGSVRRIAVNYQDMILHWARFLKASLLNLTNALDGKEPAYTTSLPPNGFKSNDTLIPQMHQPPQLIKNPSVPLLSRSTQNFLSLPLALMGTLL
jgi:hypothetical protein